MSDYDCSRNQSHKTLGDLEYAGQYGNELRLINFFDTYSVLILRCYQGSCRLSQDWKFSSLIT